MKRILLASAGLFLSGVLGVASCSSGASTTTPGAGGNNGTAGNSGGSAGSSGDAGISGGSAGTSGSAGVSGSAGDTGAGGEPTGTGGNPAGAGGATGGSSATGTGGNPTGTGGNPAGAGGATGGVTGNGGRGGTTGVGGSGGRGGTTGGGGGAAGGVTGTGGRGGTTGSGGAGGADLSVVGTWDGALVTYPCNDKRSGYDCSNIGCSGGTATKTTTWTMAGNPGTVYNVMVRIRGIVEVQAYGYPGSGMRDAGNASIANCPAAGCDLFQRGGTPMASGGVSYDYNNYELSVAPGVPTSVSQYNTYYLNSVIMNENPHASSNITSHLTFPIDYTKTIPVMGNSTITLKVFDSNCALVQNCGPTSGNTCMAPRTVSLAGAMPAPPTSFTQPFQGNVTGAYGQWVHFDVLGVTVAQ